jgi:hypothetical protein
MIKYFRWAITRLINMLFPTDKSYSRNSIYDKNIVLYVLLFCQEIFPYLKQNKGLKPLVLFEK